MNAKDVLKELHEKYDL